MVEQAAVRKQKRDCQRNSPTEPTRHKNPWRACRGHLLPLPVCTCATDSGRVCRIRAPVHVRRLCGHTCCRLGRQRAGAPAGLAVAVAPPPAPATARRRAAACARHQRWQLLLQQSARIRDQPLQGSALAPRQGALWQAAGTDTRCPPFRAPPKTAQAHLLRLLTFHA